MILSEYQKLLESLSDKIENIRSRAYLTHQNVNQHYGVKGEPYSIHLEAVAQYTMKYLPYVCDDREEVIPVIFGAFFHDSIEDARLTYNDVKHVALDYMSEEKAFLAAEIVFALTNDKGRTRAERAGEKYYLGIRTTPYAPLVKMCDRLANTSYSVKDSSNLNKRMKEVYHNEYPHFLKAITSDNPDKRYSLPTETFKEMAELLRM